MKVLLVNPSQQSSYGELVAPYYPPLGLGYLAAVITQAGHSVEIIDIDADQISDGDFREILKKDFGVVGITSTSTTFSNAVHVGNLVKESSRSLTVFGGIHVTIAPEESIKNDCIDFIIRGEGEITIVDLLSALEQGRSVYDVPGLTFYDSDKIIHTKPRELIKNLDDIPFPARHLFRQQKYTYPDSLASPVVPIITSRGCPAHCTYCCSKPLFTRVIRFRSATNVVDEIEHLIRDFGAKEIHFWDDNFSASKARVFQIRDEIKKRKIKVNFMFTSGLRVDQINEEVLLALREMGAYSMAFGVESGNQLVLDNIKKGIKLEQVEKAFALAKKVGFETWGFFMVGLPADTRQTIKDTVDFALKLDPDVAKFHILKPYPGTEAFDELDRRGLIVERDFSKYGFHTRPVHRLPDLSEDDMLKLVKQAYRRFYMRPSKILKHILRIKSWERLKLNFLTGIYLLKFMNRQGIASYYKHKGDKVRLGDGDSSSNSTGSPQARTSSQR